MKRYRNVALALSCAFTAAGAAATNGTAPPQVHNTVSNRNVHWNWNHNTNRTYHRSTNTSTLNNRSTNQQHQQQAQQQHQQQSQAVRNAGNNTGNSSAASVGNTTSVVGDVNHYQAPPRAPVSSAIAPSLVSGADTCMGSTTVGAQGVGVGFSFGNTWTDDNCVMLKNSTILWNMGKADAAVALLCNNVQVRKALEQAGTPCPDGRPQPQPQPTVAPAMVQTVAVPAEPLGYERIEPAVSARNRVDRN